MNADGVCVWDEHTAREASKKIVEDLLHTAGGNVTDEYDGEESSPSVVKRVQMEEDDTF